MARGTVLEYDPKTGSGTIVDTETGHRYTVYANYVDIPPGEHLHPGQPVEFDVHHDKHRHWAVNVHILENSHPMD